MQTTETISLIASETLKGLTSKPKFLSSKYFYDENGSKIFQRIMRMPEYYLTDCEFQIFNRKGYDIIRNFVGNNEKIELIELGAGDGLKTKLLIKEMYRQNIDFRYLPIDISEEVLFAMAESLKHEFSRLDVKPMQGDYFDMMEEIESYSKTPKVILFLGSNIGNFSYDESIQFFKNLRNIIRNHDKLFIGFDLKKEPQIILNAYDDAGGHTRDFNLNLLRRLNNELGANFDLTKFRHTPVYDPMEGTAKSYLVSTEEQEVYIFELNKKIHFKKWEAVYTEMSRKFDLNIIQQLADTAGFKVEKNFTDSRSYFVNSLWSPKV